MNKIFIFLIAVVLAGSVVCAENVKSVKPVTENVIPVLRDGFSFPNSGVEGLITKSRESQKWFFSPYKDISDMRTTVKAGWSIELLPSSTLEKIIVTMESRKVKSSTMEVNLWGKVTRYSNKGSSKILYNLQEDDDQGEVFTRNYIFPLSFNPISSVKEKVTIPKPDKGKDIDPDDPKSIIPREAKDILKAETKKTDKAPPDESKSDSIIPDDVMKMLKPKRVIDFSLKEKIPVLMKDTSLTNRTGFVTEGKEYKIFTIDAMGMNVDDKAFKLLPCGTLERTEEDIVTSPGRNRYKVSGTITKFKGEYYMLLHRAVRTYNHGNFAR